MKEELIAFETAKLAKEKGFNWDCDKTYSRVWIVGNKYPAPTQSLLQKWLREVHDINMLLEAYPDKYWILIYKGRNSQIGSPDVKGNTYEEALEKALNIALKLI